MTQVEVTVAPVGSAPRTLRFSVARQPQLTPVIVAAGVTQAIMGANDAGLANGFRLRGNITFPAAQMLATQTLYAGPQGFARALQLIREKKPVRYVGVIGPVQFDRNGDIVGPFRTWKITNGEVTTVGQMSMEDVQAVQARLPR
jgi:hypothetical protein